MRVAGTGHRPDKLGGYSNKMHLSLVKIAEDALKKLKPTEVISGMAMGWDMALAQAAINLGIPLIAAVPFKGQEKAWSEKTQRYYHKLLSKTKEIVIVSEGGFTKEKMQIRNEWMVDNCDLVLSMHNGDKFGGTFNCVSYIEKKKKPMINLYTKLKIENE